METENGVRFMPHVLENYYIVEADLFGTPVEIKSVEKFSYSNWNLIQQEISELRDLQREYFLGYSEPKISGRLLELESKYCNRYFYLVEAESPDKAKEKLSEQLNRQTKSNSL